MAPKIDRTDPPYKQVVDDIRTRITTGELREGDRVPSARQIMREWGISIATATKVHAALRSEGLTRSVTGISTVVAATARPTAKDHMAAIRTTGRIYPRGDHAEIKESASVPAPPDVADALGIEPGAMVIRRHRVTYRENRPLSASTSWFDGGLAETAPLLLETKRIPEGTPGYIERKTGLRVASGRDVITARTSSEKEAEELGIEGGSVVIIGRNWFYDTSGKVIEFGEFIASGERHLTYDYQVD
ncbi:MAG: hypothetical protein QG608_947 [Actinomycetota bacterium]|nr:hypothetical protein [Actinomycetota bacterium]